MWNVRSVRCSTTDLSICLQARKPFEREQRHNVVCNIAALNKPVESIKHLPGPTDRSYQRGGPCLCVLGTLKLGLSHEDTKNEGGKSYLPWNSCVRSSTCTTRGSGTSNVVWFIKLLLRALLLDELWTSKRLPGLDCKITVTSLYIYMHILCI